MLFSLVYLAGTTSSIVEDVIVDGGKKLSPGFIAKSMMITLATSAGVLSFQSTGYYKGWKVWILSIGQKTDDEKIFKTNDHKPDKNIVITRIIGALLFGAAAGTRSRFFRETHFSREVGAAAVIGASCALVAYGIEYGVEASYKKSEK